MPIDYSQSKIYRIIGGGLTYYGSTTRPLYVRLAEHKKYSKDRYSSWKLMHFEDLQIFLVEDFPCERKEQLNARERWYIENNDCVNTNVPTRTSKEYKIAHKEILQQQKKEWDEKNKEHRQQYAEQNRAHTNELRQIKRKEVQSDPEKKNALKEKEHLYRSTPEYKERHKNKSLNYRNKPGIKEKLQKQKKEKDLWKKHKLAILNELTQYFEINNLNK